MEAIKRENWNTLTYDIYKTKDGLYAKKSMCLEYNIGNPNDSKIILYQECFKVTRKEIYNMLNSNTRIKLKYNKIYENSLLQTLQIYVDVNHDKKLYISSKMCIKYGIEPKNQTKINNILYNQVTHEDIDNIDKQARYNNILFRRKYTLVQLTDNDKFFYYYHDQKENTMYIQREIYEDAKNLNIKIEGKPKIINDKNYYSITEEQLKDIESIFQKKGIEKIINPNNIKENNQKEKKGESSMNQESNINVIQEELTRINNQEAEIKAMLEENRRKMEAVKENIRKLMEQQPEENQVKILGDPNVDIDEIKAQLNKQLEGEKEEPNQNVVVLLGNQNVDVNEIQESIKRLIEKTAKEYTEKELKDVKIDVEQLKEELKKYLDNEDKYIIRILGNDNIDIDVIQKQIRQIVQNNAQNRLMNELNQLRLNIDSIKANLNRYTNNEVNAHLVFLLGNNNNYDINSIKEEVRKFINNTTQKNFVKILGDNNVDLDELRDKINKYIVDQKEQNIVKILGDLNVNIDEIKEQLNKHLEETADKNIVKILGNQNTDIDRVKKELDRILNLEKNQNIITILGNPNIDINEIERQLNKFIEKETNDNIIKNVSAYNIDLNAVREELLSKKRLEPTERRITQSIDDHKISVDSVEKEVANELYDEKDEKIVKILGDQQVDIYDIKRQINDIMNRQKFENIMIYKDTETGKLYAPAKYAPNAEVKVINGKEYAEVNQETIDNIKDALIIYKDITLQPMVLDITICNANEKLFISQDVLNSLGMYVVDPHKIIVNKEIYVEITKDDLDIVRSKESDALKLNITIKHITPVKG